MDKSLAVEYVDKRKWFTYEVIKKLKYGKEETIQDCKEDSRRDQQSGDNHSHFDEEEKEEESESDNDHSNSSIEKVKQNQSMMIIDLAWIHLEMK